MTWTFPPSPTEWISASGWSFPRMIFSHLTDELYESKIVYRTEKLRRPRPHLLHEPARARWSTKTPTASSPSTATATRTPPARPPTRILPCWWPSTFPNRSRTATSYGECIARLSNMLGGGVIVQRFGDLIRGQRSTTASASRSRFVTPTLDATRRRFKSGAAQA